MDLFIEDNPNCSGMGHVVFQEFEDASLVEGIMATGPQGDVRCDLVGVDPEGKFVPAYARKIADSGEGTAYLIYGGSWGIRLRPKAHQEEPWDLKNSHQWGEPYKIYGTREDIFFKPQ